MSDPGENVGKICLSFEKYHNARTGKLDVKSRPVLIIGYEDNNDTYINMDYEILPISKIGNFDPHPEYDFELNQDDIKNLGLDYLSYIRSHKTTWSNCKHMRVESPLSDMKSIYPYLFNEIVRKNHEWVLNRTNRITENVITATNNSDGLPF